MSVASGRGRPRERLDHESDSKWSGVSQRMAQFESGVVIPTIITNSLTPEQAEAFATMTRISEITAMFRNKTYIPSDQCRSPSPPPVYDDKGKRINTREFRYRKKYQSERERLLVHALKTIPGFEAPDWYKKPLKVTEKLYVPVDKHPEINFVGLLIGPRGNTLRHLEKESGTKIGIRGKGSVKNDHSTAIMSARMKLEEPLHCLITGDNEEQVAKAMKLCNEVINKAIYSGPGENDLKRNQLKELAVLNGTLREESEHICSLCGEKGHTRRDCPNEKNLDYISSLVCTKCGNVGHLAKDCRMSFEEYQGGGDTKSIMEKEFESMMNDLNGTGEVVEEKRVENHDRQGDGGYNGGYEGNGYDINGHGNLDHGNNDRGNNGYGGNGYGNNGFDNGYDNGYDNNGYNRQRGYNGNGRGGYGGDRKGGYRGGRGYGNSYNHERRYDNYGQKRSYNDDYGYSEKRTRRYGSRESPYEDSSSGPSYQSRPSPYESRGSGYESRESPYTSPHASRVPPYASRPSPYNSGASPYNSGASPYTSNSSAPYKTPAPLLQPPPGLRPVHRPVPSGLAPPPGTLSVSRDLKSRPPPPPSSLRHQPPPGLKK
ncbi:DEKNAAC103753 [Brettanomyces naardenensis]|uniref:Branchpoint-bridging protein n=1 Tax=Brettanomyces naardenensis TaxID=13370 RepID=A0A448YP79_BRENA|nr:DEKNAAC103753 [Brettanomyces naardenensis]